MNSRFVTTGYAARDLGISTATLTRWAAKDLVTPAETTAGGHYRWDMPVLKAQVRRLRTGAADAGRVQAEDIARVIHAAQRELQIVQGDPRPAPPWDDAPDYQCAECIAGVELALKGVTPEQSHEAWNQRMRADGWVYGEVKDEAAKTHPCLVPFADLPEEQQAKDILFVAIVQALRRE